MPSRVGSGFSSSQAWIRAGDRHRLLLVRLRQDDEELVAAEAGAEVVRPQLGAEGGRDHREGRVALEVAVAVVDPAQVVDVA